MWLYIDHASKSCEQLLLVLVLPRCARTREHIKRDMQQHCLSAIAYIGGCCKVIFRDTQCSIVEVITWTYRCCTAASPLPLTCHLRLSRLRPWVRHPAPLSRLKHFSLLASTCFASTFRTGCTKKRLRCACQPAQWCVVLCVRSQQHYIDACIIALQQVGCRSMQYC